MRHVVMMMVFFYTLPIHAEVLQPLSVSQNNPALLRFFNPVAIATPSNGSTLLSINQSYSSVFLADKLPKAKHYIADMELYIAELKIMHSLSPTSSIYIQLPVLRPSSGMLDPFLRHYHKALGLPNGGREYRPDNSFAYQYKGVSGGWDSQPRWELGNIQAQWRYTWSKQENLQIASALAVKLPTGSVSRGWSNGGTDVALSIITAWQKHKWASHFEVWWIHPLKRQDLGSPIGDYIRSNLSIGYQASYPFKATWIGQIQGGTSPYQTTNPALNQSPWLISGGVQFKASSDNRWQLSFIENITQASTQDFGINLELKIPI